MVQCLLARHLPVRKNSSPESESLIKTRDFLCHFCTVFPQVFWQLIWKDSLETNAVITVMGFDVLGKEFCTGLGSARKITIVMISQHLIINVIIKMAQYFLSFHFLCYLPFVPWLLCCWYFSMQLNKSANQNWLVCFIQAHTHTIIIIKKQDSCVLSSHTQTHNKQQQV